MNVYISRENSHRRVFMSCVLEVEKDSMGCTRTEGEDVTREVIYKAPKLRKARIS